MEGLSPQLAFPKTLTTSIPLGCAGNEAGTAVTPDRLSDGGEPVADRRAAKRSQPLRVGEDDRRWDGVRDVGDHGIRRTGVVVEVRAWPAFGDNPYRMEGPSGVDVPCCSMHLHVVQHCTDLHACSLAVRQKTEEAGGGRGRQQPSPSAPTRPSAREIGGQAACARPGS